MSSRQGASNFLEDRRGSRHHLPQLVLNLRLKTVRHLRDREDGVWLSSHGPAVTQRVHNRYLTEDVRIIYERTKKIDGVHSDHSWWNRNDGRIVRLVKSDFNLRASRNVEAGHHSAKYAGPNLRSTTTTTHGDSLQGGDGCRTSRERNLRYIRLWGCHHWHLLIHLHPLPIDVVLPLPEHCPR